MSSRYNNSSNFGGRRNNHQGSGGNNGNDRRPRPNSNSRNWRQQDDNKWKPYVPKHQDAPAQVYHPITPDKIVSSDPPSTPRRSQRPPQSEVHQFRPKQSRYEQKPKSQTSYVELIPTNFNSFQIRELCDQMWSNNAFEAINELLHFFETLRKAIMHANLKGREEHLDPIYPSMLAAIHPALPVDLVHSWFACEMTPRPDGSTEYDEETWSKMFIQMLPRVDQCFPVTVEMFKLIGEISQQITQSEICVIRKKIMQSNASEMNIKLENIAADGEDQGWSQEKIEFEQKKVKDHYTQEMVKIKKDRTDEIWKMYDDMYDYASKHDVADMNDIRMKNYWRFITRNPCFPDSRVVLNGLILDAHDFSLVEAFSHTATQHAHNFATIRKWFFGLHSSLNPLNVKLNEFNDWMSVCHMLEISERLALLVSDEKVEIDRIASFDDAYFRLLSAMSETKFGQTISNQMEESEYTKILENKVTTKWLRKSQIYPYGSVKLFGYEQEDEPMTLLNRATRLNKDILTEMLSAYPPQVVSKIIAKKLTDGQDGFADVFCKIAADLMLDPLPIFETYCDYLSQHKSVDSHVTNCFAPLLMMFPPTQQLSVLSRMLGSCSSDERRSELLGSFKKEVERRSYFFEALEHFGPIVCHECRTLLDRKALDHCHKFSTMDVIEAFVKAFPEVSFEASS